MTKLNILVTGSSRGIGKAIVASLDGHQVVGHSSAGGDGRVAADLSQPGAAESLWHEALARLGGRIDVLVNNAGVSQPKTLIEISEAEYDETIAINLKGCFAWCKAVAPAMLTQKSGRIINISSVSAHMGASPNAVSRFAYCAAKAGVLGLTRALCKELAPHVTVNAICPGSVRTAFTEKLFDQREEEIIEAIPLRRLGTPEDIAEVVAFLATVSPNFITGEIIDVDGGQYVN
jgi:3-oxoacyl-[acyl-carrier protein] reductase